ncbi:Mei2-like, C-terminal RNA recognition motif [Dillenia turbinata]|uniref:Mei2-like, C-terminal RNA recognition motif n=1 Tax=Dillenia turbinata TaxID=194707 RepID=A0AAN8Z4M2_9MAGN
MPFEVMDRRALSASSHLVDELCFPTERQVGFWQQRNMVDHQDGRLIIPNSKLVTSSHLDNILPIGAKSVGSFELPQSHLGRDRNEKLQIEGDERVSNLSAPSHRPNTLDQETRSMQLSSCAMNENRIKINEIQYESNLFSMNLSMNELLIHKSVNPVASTCAEEEPFESTEEIEAQTIGNLLPDEDDLFSGMADELGYIAHAGRGEDLEDFDLFSSGGGMELEADENTYVGPNSAFSAGLSNGRVGFLGSTAGEHPSGEHPSRTLFVRNINSNVEDSELRVLFEQFGDIRTLYTVCKHRGFVMISFYDIRAAQNALRMLQNKPLRRRKLDIHYSIPKDNPPEKDVNQGMLVVSNLDPSISNDDLHQIFAVYGEIREIRETPLNCSHKFVEFYDVRAAEAALHALNKSDIGGKQFKLETSHANGAKPCMLQQCISDLEDNDHILSQSADQKSTVGNMATTSMKAVMPTSTENGSIHGLHSSNQLPLGAFNRSALEHGSSSVSGNFQMQVRVASLGNQFGRGEPGHTLDQMKFRNQCRPSTQPHSLPEFHDHLTTGISYNSSSLVPDMVGRAGSKISEGIDNRFLRMVNSNPSVEPNGSGFGTSGNGSCPLHGHTRMWNNSNSYQHPPSSPVIWPNPPSIFNGIHAHCPPQHPGFPRLPSHLLNTPPLHHHHVGSAPAINPSLWDRRHGFMAESSEASGFHIGSLENIGFPGTSPLHLEIASHNLFAQAGGKCMELTSNLGLCSPQQMGHMFPGRNSMTSVGNTFGSPMERVRGRRSEANSVDRKQYELDIDRILRGEDTRTTLMIKNIPNKYTSKMLLAAIDERHRGTYDFIYLPIDFKANSNKCNVGYAFINMIDPLQIVPFHQAFNGKKWEKFNSEKVASLAYARIQGKAALIAHFQNSSLMNEDKRCRPILFHTDGPNAGDQEPFPMGTNIRPRPGKPRSSMNDENHQQEGSPTSGKESSNGVDILLGCPKDSE